MKILEFLADHVFRFRYRDPAGKNDAGLITFDIGIAEEVQDKMLKDFFIMGCVTAFVLALILAVTGVSAWLIAH